MKEQQVIFHGGCLGCDSQHLYGKKRCVGCQYFECNWDLPNLSTEHLRINAEMARIRQDFRNSTY